MEWFKKWFNEDYLLVYGSRNRASAAAEIDQMSRWTGLPSCQSVLDLGCGAGRHLGPLAQYAARVTGVDLSETLLEVAREDLQKLEDNIRSRISICQGDLRSLPFSPHSFDFLCSLFTSFGYLENDDAHLNLLRHWQTLCQSGGNLFLDCINPTHLKKHLEPTSVRDENSFRIRECRELTENGKYIEKHVVVDTPVGTSREYRERVRLFSSEDLESLLAQAGFSQIRLAGDYSGLPFSDDSERLIVLGTSK